MGKIDHVKKLVIIIPLLFISGFNILAEEVLPEIINKVKPSTVLILIYNKEGEITARGSGFFISQDGEIITNRHLLEGAYRAEVKTSNEKVYSITRVVAEDKEADIVMVKVDTLPESVRPLTVSSSTPQVGEKVVVIGNPLGLEGSVSDGIVSAVRDIPGLGTIIQITAPVSPGSSGSPVINAKGEVIGVATFQLVEGQNLNFAVSGQRITQIKKSKSITLDEWRIGKTKNCEETAEGLYYSGLFYLLQDEYDKALSYFKKAAEKNPTYSEAYFYIGYCYGKLGRLTEEIEAYKQAIRIKPDLAEAHCGLGVAYYKLGRPTEAIEAFKQAIRIKPDYAEAHYNLGVAYAELG
ncbi:MAG: tetratricopeptide repeat protein, partial [Desulfobacterota bacterium]|nr:tetratricopeptide repeat protein [Thermodesulfobacteriota bacterium]